MCDDVEKDCTSGRHRQAKMRADHDEWPTQLMRCRRAKDPEALDASTHTEKIHQQQRNGLTENSASNGLHDSENPVEQN